MSDCLRNQFSSNLVCAWEYQVLAFLYRLDIFTLDICSYMPDDILVSLTSQGVSCVPLQKRYSCVKPQEVNTVDVLFVLCFSLSQVTMTTTTMH